MRRHKRNSPTGRTSVPINTAFTAETDDAILEWPKPTDRRERLAAKKVRRLVRVRWFSSRDRREFTRYARSCMWTVKAVQFFTMNGIPMEEFHVYAGKPVYAWEAVFECVGTEQSFDLQWKDWHVETVKALEVPIPYGGVGTGPEKTSKGGAGDFNNVSGFIA